MSISKTERDDVDKIAKSLGVNPKSYPREFRNANKKTEAEGWTWSQIRDHCIRCRREWVDRLPRYHMLGYVALEFLKRAAKDAGIPASATSWRTKEPDSFVGKILRNKSLNPLNDFPDLVGARLILFYEDHVRAFDKQVERFFAIDDSEDKQLRNIDEMAFGYDSVHIVGRLNPDTISGNNPRSGLTWQYAGNIEEIDLAQLRNLRVELQIRTIAMHAWAEPSHQLDYKTDGEFSARPGVKRRLRRISAILELVDEEFKAVRDAIQEQSSRRFRVGP